MCGGGGTQTTTQEFKPPARTEPGWDAYVAEALKLNQTPYQQSGLPTVAPINDYQNTAMQLAYNKALYGSPDMNAARGSAMNAAQGNYANPYTQNVAGIASGQAYNPALEGYAKIAAGQDNPYMSDAYTQQIIQNTAGEMANGFATGTAAQNDAAAAMQGAYGGSAYQQKQAGDAAALSKQIGNMASQVQQQQQQYKGGQYQQGIQNQLAGLGGYAAGYNADVGNQLNANAQAMGGWQNDIGNILSGSGLAGQLSQDDYKSTQGLMDAGNNWNSYYQKLMDSYNNQWNAENMYGQMMNQQLGNALSQASGSYGTSMNTIPGQQSGLAGLLGLGAAGAGMYSLYKG